MIWIGGWGMEESPSSRAKCKYCGKKISHGELRIAIPNPESIRGGSRGCTYHHYDCWEEKVKLTMEYHKMGYDKACDVEMERRDKLIADRVREITRETKSKRLRIGP
jgi:hypothetical protein